MEVVLRVTSGPHEGLERVGEGQGSFLVGRSSHVSFSMPDDRLLSREHFWVEVNPPLCDLTTFAARMARGQRSTGREGAAPETATRLPRARAHLRSASRKRRTGRRLRSAVPAAECSRGRLACPRRLDPVALARECDGRRLVFPKTHPDYLIEKSIGEGGMGEVFQARQLSTNRPVAIKMMASTGAASEKAKEILPARDGDLEGLADAERSVPPNIVAFYDIFEIDDQFQLAMEYVPGKNALEWMSNLSAPLPTTSAARIGRLLLSALEYAHDKGYVHRDVKPSNLLIMGPVARPKVKLSDFGLAKSFRENPGFGGLTRPGGRRRLDRVHLTRPYPRLSRGQGACRPLQCRRDALYLLTGQYPYLNFNPYKAEAYTMIPSTPLSPFARIERTRRKGWSACSPGALAKQPRDRWKSARAMADAAAALLGRVGGFGGAALKQF